MADDDIRQSSLAAIRQMRAEGLTKATPAEAPEIELDENFWRNARIVESKAVAVLDRPTRPETLTSIMRELFGPENGVELELPPREAGREPPVFE